jgi:hypothetical protein
MLRPQNSARLNPVIGGLTGKHQQPFDDTNRAPAHPKEGGNRANLLIITFEVNQNTT